MNIEDKEELKKRAEDLRLELEQNRNDLKFILETPQGIRFFQRFFNDGFIYTTTFTGNSRTFFLEGHRNFALKYFAEITETIPEVLPKLLLKKKIDFNANKNNTETNKKEVR